MPHLVQVQETYAKQSFSMVGLTDVDPETARAFAREYELNFPVLANGEAVREAYGVDLVWGSSFFLIDPEGTIVAQGLDDCEERLAREFGAAE